MDLFKALMLLPGLVIGLTLHEFAHAWSASLLGDKFARRQGRVSLNPLRHLSPLGTLAIFVLPFGWGRPVLVNLYNFKRPKRDYLITSLAGPVANLIVVAVCIGLMQLTRHCYRFGQMGEILMIMAHSMLFLVGLINMMLATINLIPIPPLDGSKIWPCIIPGLKPSFGGRTTWIFIVILLALVWTDSLDPLISFSLEKVQGMMPVSDSQIFDDRYESAMAAYDAGDFAEAENRFTAALEINPRSHDCLHRRACARGWRNNWPGALEDMNRAIELYRLNPQYYEFRATVFRHLGRIDEAKKDFDTARALQRTLTPASRPTQTAPS